MHVTRYAIYVVPDGPLGQFGAQWLGWDVVAGLARPHPAVKDLDIAAITAQPRKYGFHGTIKPPFRLAEGTTPEELIARTESLCAQLAPVTLPALRLARLGRFMALAPEVTDPSLQALAAACVQGLDMFRKPSTAEERGKRREAGLSARQEHNLLVWGYPYVMEDFAFHLTLTGPLEADLQDRTAEVLKGFVARFVGRPHRIDTLSLCGEGPDGMLRELHRYSLSG